MQKKIIQQQIPQVRKVLTTGTSLHHPQQQANMQMNAVKKINSLLQSGSVSVTGIPAGQQRVMQRKPISSTSVSITSTSTNNYVRQAKCYICGEHAGLNAVLISEARTSTSNTEYVAKLAKVIGSNYSVVLSVEDVICRRCSTILNQLDKLESDVDGLRSTLLGFIHKKNNIPDDGDALGGSPPTKMQKLAHVVTTTGGGGALATSVGNVTYSIKTSGQQPQNVLVDADTLKALNTSGSGSEMNISGATDMETDLFDKSTSSPGTSFSQTVKQHTLVTTNNGGMAVTGTAATVDGVNRKTSKLFKCMPCGFKTTDLALFKPHYANCAPRNAAIMNSGLVNTSSIATTNTGTTTTTTSSFRCKLCKLVFSSIALLKQHNLQDHQQTQLQKVGITNAGGQPGKESDGIKYSCNMCEFRTNDKKTYDDHLRRHIRLKPFKCRICLTRFETREQASVHAKQHQKEFLKCTICGVQFTQKEMLELHQAEHEAQLKSDKAQQQDQQPAATGDSSTQKLLQESIDEALRETIGDSIDAKLIQFHTCNACSLTFLSEKLYMQHIKTHAHGAAGIITTGLAQGQQTTQQMVLSNSATAVNRKSTVVTSIDGGSGGLNAKILTTTTSAGSGNTNANSSTISDGDLESIFERMHSDPKVAEAGATATTAEGGSMVITNQDGTTGNITFNITLPQQDDSATAFVQQQQQQTQLEEHPQSVGIDMPTLDQGDEQQQQQKDQQQLQTMPVSMPSLDDDGEQSQNSQNSNTENVPMELDDIQSGEGQQINLILNDGQVLQLDNHILTTDAEGNQILVQGTDSEQIQQLLQSVGVVMQGSEGLGEGETLQMISGDGNNQMILVQGADGQEQLIDASLLNADGNIVIQQSQEGELNAEGTHITTEDGLQIPVSVAFTTSGEAGHEGQLTVSVADGSEQQLQLHLQQAGEADAEDQQHAESGDHQQQPGAILTESGQIILQPKEEDQSDAGKVGDENGMTNESVESDGGPVADEAGQTNGGPETIVTTLAGGTTSNGTTITTNVAVTGTTSNAVTASSATEDQMFNFDELIQPQIVIKQQQVK